MPLVLTLHNSFEKLFDQFENSPFIGVTSTPFTSDVNLPMDGLLTRSIKTQKLLGSRGFCVDIGCV